MTELVPTRASVNVLVPHELCWCDRNKLGWTRRNYRRRRSHQDDRTQRQHPANSCNRAAVRLHLGQHACTTQRANHTRHPTRARHAAAASAGVRVCGCTACSVRISRAQAAVSPDQSCLPRLHAAWSCSCLVIETSVASEGCCDPEALLLPSGDRIHSCISLARHATSGGNSASGRLKRC